MATARSASGSWASPTCSTGLASRTTPTRPSAWPASSWPSSTPGSGRLARARRGARRVPQLRGLGLRLRGRSTPAQRHRHDDRADRHHLHHRGLLERHRAALRAQLPAPQSARRRRDARGLPLLRGGRAARGLLLRGVPQARRRRGLGAPCRRSSRGLARPVRHRPRRHARMAHQAAGGLPGGHRQRRLQDGQLPQSRHGRRRREGLPARLPLGLQGRNHLS